MMPSFLLGVYLTLVSYTFEIRPEPDDLKKKSFAVTELTDRYCYVIFEIVLNL